LFIAGDDIDAVLFGKGDQEQMVGHEGHQTREKADAISLLVSFDLW
jgi:hypothetical protein